MKPTLQLFQTLIKDTRMYTNTRVVILHAGNRYKPHVKHMREIDIELPPFKKVWYKEEKEAKEFTIIREVHVKMKAYLQEVMPQGIKNTMEVLKSRGGGGGDPHP